jgi:hypothetical protein
VYPIVIRLVSAQPAEKVDYAYLEHRLSGTALQVPVDDLWHLVAGFFELLDYAIMRRFPSLVRVIGQRGVKLHIRKDKEPLDHIFWLNHIVSIDRSA